LESAATPASTVSPKHGKNSVPAVFDRFFVRFRTEITQKLPHYPPRTRRYHGRKGDQRHSMARCRMHGSAPVPSLMDSAKFLSGVGPSKAPQTIRKRDGFSELMDAKNAEKKLLNEGSGAL